MVEDITQAITNEYVNQPKKKFDWLLWLAIIIMLVGCYLVIQESQVCKTPFKQIIDKQLKEDFKDFPQVNISYSYARLDIYSSSNDITPITSYDVVGNKLYQIAKGNSNFNFSNLINK